MSMLKRLSLGFLASSLFVASGWSAQLSRNSNKVIYGDDNRLDLYQVADTGLLRLADATVALFRSQKLMALPDGSSVINVYPYGQANQLCTDEPFYNQYSGAFCSGSLVGPDLILTAGHCVTSAQDCSITKFVFGFAVRDGAHQAIGSVPTSEVYGCKEIVAREQVSGGADYALVRLNRAVTNHTPLEINRSGGLTQGTQLVLIGNPSGLPTKVAAGAFVRNNDAAGFFVATTDSYGGNSGSAVFNASTGLIEGILVRGEVDFSPRPVAGCMESYKCGDWECRGEDVTRISAVAAQIPETSSGGVRMSADAGVPR